jgi:tetratricopeptide (TPR) repeat protein
MVMKALEKDRNRRYETANGFARDIQRYLADEPVLAGPPSARYRLRKFVRRNKGRVVATAALVMAVIVGVVAVVAVQAKANRDLSAANRQLEEANEQVRQRFGLAMEAVELFHGEVSKDLLLKEKQFDGLRNKLLRGAATFYEKLEGLLKDQDDPASRATLGKAYHELGILTARIGDDRSALEVHRKALAVRQELAVRADAGPETILDVARSLIEVGKMQIGFGEPDGAIVSIEKAQATAEQVETIFGASDSSRSLRADAYTRIGYILDDEDRMDECLAAMERARVIRQALVDAHPLDRAYQKALANSHDNLAIALIETGKYTQGMAERHKARAHWFVATADPSDLEGQAALAISYGNIGVVYSRGDLFDEALKSLEAGLAIYKRLLEANPSVTRFHEESSAFSMGYGEALQKVGRLAEARAALERSRDIHQRLVAAHPDVIDYRSMLAQIRTSLGGLYHATGQLDAARTEYDQASAVLEELVKAYPNVSLHRYKLTMNLRRLGLLEYAGRRFAEAADANRRAIELSAGENLWNQHSFQLSCCRAMLAELAGKDGSGVPADAGPVEADKAMDMLRKAVTAGFRSPYDLRTDAGLDSLRQRDDFKKLLAELEAKVKGSSKSPAQP